MKNKEMENKITELENKITELENKIIALEISLNQKIELKNFIFENAFFEYSKLYEKIEFYESAFVQELKLQNKLRETYPNITCRFAYGNLNSANNCAKIKYFYSNQIKTINAPMLEVVSKENLIFYNTTSKSFMIAIKTDKGEILKNYFVERETGSIHSIKPIDAHRFIIEEEEI